MKNEYRIDIKVRNNLILEKIEQAGYKTISEFCKKTGINYQYLCRLIALKMGAVDARDNHRAIVLELCSHLKCDIDELFTERQKTANATSNSRTLKVNEYEMMLILQRETDSTELLEDDVSKLQLNEAIEEVLSTLTEREAKVIKMRNGIGNNGECTYDEISKHMGVTRERIRQIEQKALIKLRYESRAKKIEGYLEQD